MSPGAPPEPAAGERRNAESHAAILRATVELLEENGYRHLTVEGVARRAGVGKQTIYRWWQGSRAALVMEAFAAAGDVRVEPPDTGSVRADLLGILEPVFDLQSDPRQGVALANRALMAEAQLDADFHERYLDLHRHWWGPLLLAVERGVERGELEPDTDAQQVVDLLLGFAWYRLLLGHGSLDVGAARAVVDVVLQGVARATP